jgi:hypothetical protein
MQRSIEWGLRCAVVGFSVALFLASLAYCLNAAHVRYDLDIVYLILWPASLGLMATENASAAHQVLIVLTLSLINAVTYFAIGFVAGLLPKSEGPA